MRREFDGRGRPVYANVEIQDEDGNMVNGYMQQSLFTSSLYEYIINYHNGCAKHHIREAHEYPKNLDVRYSIQIELPFPKMKSKKRLNNNL